MKGTYVKYRSGGARGKREEFRVEVVRFDKTSERILVRFEDGREARIAAENFQPDQR